ncbi:c-type cytochrome [Stutzerimonas stutzeri]|uniref:c-type cytochrome n=1 Tax=Stutzerimonas stutzeri TaxID=316 RepID=UPI0015E3DE21|nr:c-type cytochrome [Stutzerimonas stutzeri]MBA1261392.1 c-type cytochrome [Stutzerimonas stutzeri]
MRIFVCFLLSFLAPFAGANEEAMTRFNYLMADEQRRQQAFEAGRERALFCGYCHGENGNSKRPHIPNLAAQNPIYLFHAFEQFARGEREDYVMTSLAKNLTMEDRVNIAVYFSQQKVLPTTAVVDEALSRQGETLFKRTCVGCHGVQGQGMETMPRLAGQPGDYIRKALTRFRNNDPARAGSVMLGIASQLSDEDIEALAIYLPQLEPSEQEEKQNMAKLLGTASW